MGTINRIKDVTARLMLKRKSYIRRSSFVALVSVLLVSFQNCSQGKFDIDEAKVVSASKGDSSVSGSGNTSGTGGTGGGTTPPIVTPPPPPPPPPPVVASDAEVAAEIARRQRCKSAIKAPIVTNTADFNNKIINVKSGLGTGSGDMSLPDNPVSVTIDASHGIDSTKYLTNDLCLFRTQLIVEAVSETGREAILDQGINSAGDNLVVADANGSRAVDHMGRALQLSVDGDNGGNGDYVMGSHTLGANMEIRQANQDTGLRDTRCVQGSLYYRLRARVETQGLNAARATYPASIQIGDANIFSAPVYVKVEVENNCWKQFNLAKMIGAANAGSIPSANAHLGTSVAIDGEWAASVSDTEGGTGYIYIFRKVSGNWSFFQKLKGPNGNGTALTGVALKGTLLVVASGGDGLYRPTPPRPGYPGRVYTYNLSGSALTTPSQVIDNPVGLGTKFGSGIAIVGAGNSLAIGDSYSSGKAYLFNLNGGLYGEGSGANRTASATVDGSSINAAILGFGANMVCQNGRLIVAAYNGNDSYAGSVHIYDAAGGSFGSPIHKSTPAGFTSKANFGFSIAFDGTALLVGAYENATTANAAGGIAYYADYTSSAAPKVIQGSQEEERYGVSVAMVGDSIYIGSRGGTGSSGTILKYAKSTFATANYNSRNFVQRSHDAANGEGFSYSMSILNGASVPTLLVSSQTKDYFVNSGDIRSKAGGLYLYEVK